MCFNTLNYLNKYIKYLQWIGTEYISLYQLFGYGRFQECYYKSSNYRIRNLLKIVDIFDNIQSVTILCTNIYFVFVWVCSVAIETLK